MGGEKRELGRFSGGDEKEAGMRRTRRWRSPERMAGGRMWEEEQRRRMRRGERVD